MRRTAEIINLTSVASTAHLQLLLTKY
jgi:hypothetical protein